MTNILNTVLITGGAKRIGAGVAKILAANGFKLAIHYNKSRKQANELCSELNSKKKIAFPVSGNLQNEKDVENIFFEAKKKLGNIFCLINNASTFEYDNLSSFNNDFWEKHLFVNLKAPVLLCKLFKKNLPSKYNGKIINIIDQRVFNLTPHFLSYTLSKSGLWTLTKTLALDLAPNITVNAIGPGPTLKSKFQTKKQFENQCKNMPLKVGTTTQEIGKTVLFFIKSSSITGQMLALDGGQHLGWGQVNNKEIDKE
tara:strand:- start:75 stop:842 length:768 start_codon:yes stop_codon:yes gene_type:complete